MKTNISQSVLWSVGVILSIFFLIYLFFWKQIKEYFIKEFWLSMSDKNYLNTLLGQLSSSPDSILFKKKQ